MKGRKNSKILISTFSLLLSSSCFLPSRALQQYVFHLGHNASIPFYTMTSSNGSHVTCELFSLRENRPFYVNGKIDQTVLLPNQRGRFDVSESKEDENITITLSINAIQQSDIGVYILSLRERSNGYSKDQILDAYVDVKLPPGKAECNISDVHYSAKWRQVSCEATCGSDGGGDIVCYQNGDITPYKKPLVYSSNRMTAVYWMHTGSPINCCSHDTSAEVDPTYCADFINNTRDEEKFSTSTFAESTDQILNCITASAKSEEDPSTSWASPATSVLPGSGDISDVPALYYSNEKFETCVICMLVLIIIGVVIIIMFVLRLRACVSRACLDIKMMRKAKNSCTTSFSTTAENI